MPKKMKGELAQLFEKVESPEANFLSLPNYGFPIMEKELLPKLLIKCWKD